MTPLAVIAFRFGMNADGKHDIAGMRQVIVFYSVITVFSGLLVLWKMRDDGSKIDKSEQVTFKDIGTVLRMPAIWIIGLVTFCNYVFTLSVYYFTPYGTSLLGMSVTAGAVLAAAKRYVTPVSTWAAAIWPTNSARAACCSSPSWSWPSAPRRSCSCR